MNRSTGAEVYRLPGHGKLGGHRTVEFSTDSSRFASWGDDMHLRVWDVRTGKALLDVEIQPAGNEPADDDDDPFGPRGSFNMRRMMGLLSSDASWLLLRYYGSSYLFDAATGKEIRKLPSETRIETACFSPDGSKLLFARAASAPTETKLQDGRVRSSGPPSYEFVLMDLKDDSVLWKFQVDGVYGPMAFSPDRRVIAVSTRRHFGDGDEVFFLDAPTGRKLATISDVHRIGWAMNGQRMAFSRDGRRFAAGLRDTTALVWRLSDLGL
ncbi:MAG: WD40 repeat domain-containing protein [Pirellulaceae bacterium]